MAQGLSRYFKEFYPYLWEHYKFLFERRTSIKKDFEFLLAFESLILLAYISLFGKFILQLNYLFIIPLLSFSISIGMSFYNIFPIRIWFPWFEKENWRDYQLDKKNVYEKLWEDILGVVPHLVEYDKRKGKLFFKNVLSIYISIVLSISVILIFYGFLLPLLLFIPISIISWSLIMRNWNREAVPYSPTSEIKNFLDDWKNRKD